MIVIRKGRNIHSNYIQEMREMDYVLCCTQIFFVYTCRANKILLDFIIEVYFKKLGSGHNNLNASDPKDFIKTAMV